MTCTAPCEVVALEPGDSRTRGGGPQTAQWWLTVDGTPVGFIQVLFRLTAGGPHAPRLTVCDLEVRDGYRGRGMGRALVAAVEQHYGHRLHTSGSYTPLGFAAFGAHLPVTAGGEAAVLFPDMVFVDDWDTRTARFPL